MFARVSTLYIEDCPLLESIPRCPLVESINVDASSRVVQYLMSSFLEASAFTCLRHVDITSDDKLDIIHFSSLLPHLEHISIYECNQLKSFHVEDLPSLRVLKIAFCTRLKKLYVLNLNVLEELRILGCDADLDLWGQQKASHVDWVSLTNLRLLIVDRFPKRIPNVLEHLQTLSNLVIARYNVAQVLKWFEGPLFKDPLKCHPAHLIKSSATFDLTIYTSTSLILNKLTICKNLKDPCLRGIWHQNLEVWLTKKFIILSSAPFTTRRRPPTPAPPGSVFFSHTSNLLKDRFLLDSRFTKICGFAVSIRSRRRNGLEPPSGSKTETYRYDNLQLFNLLISSLFADGFKLDPIFTAHCP